MEEHKEKSPKSIKFGVITLSDSKYRDFLESKTTDVSGNLIVDTLKKEHKLVFYTVIPDSSELLLSTVADIKEQNVDVIITTGGTGIGVRDITIETLKPLFEKELNGFGEIFRYESYKEIGAGALSVSYTHLDVYKRQVLDQSVVQVICISIPLLTDCKA